MVGYDLEANEFIHKGENLDVKALGREGKDGDATTTTQRFSSVCQIDHLV